MDFLISIASLLTGWILDLLLGDPERLPHLIVWMGKSIKFCERIFNKGNHRVIKGGIVAFGLIVVTFIICKMIISLLSSNQLATYIFESLIIFYCLSGTTLVKEVKIAFLASDKSVEEGRKQISRIVGRDTSKLSIQEIKTAALETLSENLSDGVVAPLFWFIIFGVPGMLSYKMVNTLDSMIGYKNERYQLFGRWAARIDDIANYIPARLTAFLMVLISGKWELFTFVKANGSKHASPNSGYPEAALAGILDCRFGGTHDYFGKAVYKPYIGTNDKILSNKDLKTGIYINRVVEIAMFFLTILLSYLRFKYI